MALWPFRRPGCRLSARAAGDGDLLIRLAAIAGASGDGSTAGRGTFYLVEGFRLGNLEDAFKFEALRFLDELGWYPQAKALAERLHDDEGSSRQGPGPDDDPVRPAGLSRRPKGAFPPGRWPNETHSQVRMPRVRVIMRGRADIDTPPGAAMRKRSRGSVS